MSEEPQAVGPFYPAAVCAPCGKRYGRRPVRAAPTFHAGICDLCFDATSVTEPRDFGHLLPGWEAAAAYRDASHPARACDHCRRLYRGPAVYCSLRCALADA